MPDPGDALSIGGPNPVMPGFSPDPSVVQVDGMYYLVNSTFEYLPGIPVYRSHDLVEWVQIGNVVTRPEQVEIGNVPTPGGVWAPTIRYRDGTYYVIVTVMLGGRGCVVFTATDPAGPWSDGVQIPAVPGIDPDLAWDDDGVAHVTYAQYPDAIWQVRVDLASGAALEDVRPLWRGSGLYAPEGPHLYRRDGFWYLLAAEGGTDRGHAVTVARGPSPAGPFTSFEGNPILSARSTGGPVQNLGHADLFDTPAGDTVMVLLGVRPLGLAQAFSPLGRETFATRVRWVDGWPHAEPVVLAPAVGPDFGTDFSAPDVLDDPGWIAVRQVPAEVATGSTAGPGLTITADGGDLSGPRPRFLGRRQRHLSATVSTHADATHGVGGLAARHDEQHWFGLAAQGDGEVTVVTAWAVLAGLRTSWQAGIPGREVELRIEMTPPPSDFSAGAVGGDRIRLIARAGSDGAEAATDVVLAVLDGRYWSFETAKSFTGRVLGLFASEGTVEFADFIYEDTSGAE